MTLGTEITDNLYFTTDNYDYQPEESGDLEYPGASEELNIYGFTLIYTKDGETHKKEFDADSWVSQAIDLEEITAELLEQV